MKVAAVMNDGALVAEKPPIGAVLNLIGTTQIKVRNGQMKSILASTQMVDDTVNSRLFVVRFEKTAL